MLTQQDLKQLAQKGISEAQIERQLGEFKTGFPFLKLEAAVPLAKALLLLRRLKERCMSTLGNSIKLQAERS